MKSIEILPCLLLKSPVFHATLCVLAEIGQGAAASDFRVASWDVAWEMAIPTTSLSRETMITQWPHNPWKQEVTQIVPVNIVKIYRKYAKTWASLYHTIGV